VEWNKNKQGERENNKKEEQRRKYFVSFVECVPFEGREN
jgi:hypothetical protein